MLNMDESVLICYFLDRMPFQLLISKCIFVSADTAMTIGLHIAISLNCFHTFINEWCSSVSVKL